SRYIQGPQHKSVHDAKNNRVCSNAQCEREDGNRSKAGRLSQHANRKADILCKRLDRGYTSRIAAFFRHPIDAAKLHARPSLSLRRITILTRLHLEMKLQFVLEVLFDLPAEKQRAQSENKVFPQHFKLSWCRYPTPRLECLGVECQQQIPGVLWRQRS